MELKENSCVKIFEKCYKKWYEMLRAFMTVRNNNDLARDRVVSRRVVIINV